MAVAAACSSSDADNASDGGAPPEAGASADGGPQGDGAIGPANDGGPPEAGDDPWGPRATLPSGPPVEKGAANAPSQTPAFPGQTRAPGDPTNVAFDVRVVATGLAGPWAVAFLPDGAQLVTQKAGQLRIVEANGQVSAPVAGVPSVDSSGQGGLLDVVLDPAFAQSSLVYFSYAQPREGGAGTAVARGRLVRGENRLADVTVIWRMEQTRPSGGVHFGSRLVFARDGNLFVTVGERGVGNGADNARNVASAYGKVLRIRPDGSIPNDNPLVGQAGALPEIWSFGHRNPQSAALHPKTGELWTVEHGARGGDEVNISRAGKDHGWPTVTYGIDYSGNPIGDGLTALAGVEQPVYYWDPVIAPAGAAFYDAAAFPAWRGSLFVGGLAGKHLARLTIADDRVIGEERLLVERASRIRDVRVSPSGTLFVCDETKGELLEIKPR